ncbi:adenylate kinase 7-like isoform X1 [Anthonomus grandis grandis]|uniref:adenylate kinase 7-like isoform X1 n=1 Tax=Anthonomus grandis grandis TaxID=2921223 RepID=UPI0021662F09|nr:adenylate kinase 7-like isoform X1 [Anthonomus grandis grandis]
MSTQNDAAKNMSDQFADVLKPLKLMIHGPPAVGKTEIARRICKMYGAHYVSVKTMIEETLDELRQNITHLREQALLKKTEKNPKESEMEEEVEEEEEEADEDNLDVNEDIAQYEEQIRDIDGLMTNSPNNKLPDEYVVRLMRLFLAKDRCQSHGYVLDGFPKTIQQAKELFGQAAEVTKEPAEGKGGILGAEEVSGEHELGGQVGDMLGNASLNIMPDFVVSLQAKDEFLCERIMRLPEKVIQGTHYDEPNMIRRLMEFRVNNSPDNSVLNFFDEAEIHPILIDLTDDTIEETENILSYLYSIFGPPIPGFGLTKEEEDELRKLEMEKKRMEREAYQIEKQLKEETAKKEYEEKKLDWQTELEVYELDEEKRLVDESEKYRFYIIKHLCHILNRAFVDIVRIKPDDPIDYLAEYLLRENPEVKMFNPTGPSLDNSGGVNRDSERQSLEESNDANSLLK